MEVSAYLKRIRYFEPIKPDVETLRGLQRAHLLAVPFENLDIGLKRPIRLDLESQTVRGESVGIESVPVAQTVGSATANFDVSQTGTLIYVAPNRRRLRTLVWVDRRGHEQALPVPPDQC